MKAEFVANPTVNNGKLRVVNIGRASVGVDLLTGWCVKINGSVRPINLPGDAMPLLPILELDRSEFFDELERIESSFPEYRDSVALFPENRLIEFALGSSISDYWPSKALNWIEVYPKSAVTFNVLMKELAVKKWVTQSLKQRIYKLTMAG